MENQYNFDCNICNKKYSNQKSFLHHRRTIHGIYCIDNGKRKNKDNNCYTCEYCDKEYKFSQSRWRHQKTCKFKIPIDNQEMSNALVVIQQPIIQEMEKIKEENQRLKEQMEKSEEIIKLQKKLLKTKRLDNKTFKAVNKILMDRSYRNSQNNNINSNNVVNNNTYQIFSLGNEELTNVLTMQQKKMIMNSRLGSLEKIVEIAHLGDYNQFKNILITNLKDNYAYRYDDKVGYFVTVPKNVLLEDVVSHRVTDIEAIYDELQTANKIDTKTKKLIQDFLDKIANENTPFFDNETKYENFKSYKINNIKILLYNNQDKITKDIALLISDENKTPNLIENVSQ